MEVQTVSNAIRVPKLSKDVEIFQFDENTYLIQQHKYGFNLRLTEFAKNLVNMVDGRRTLQMIQNQYHKQHKVYIELGTIDKFFYENLAPYGIIESDEKSIEKNDATYLFFRKTLIPTKYVERVSHLFSFLFDVKVFFTSFFLLLFTLSLFLSFELGWALFDQYDYSINWFYILLILLTSLFFHELGHVTACRKFDVKHGDIGFAFYIFFPVLYADVSNAWKLPRLKRIIIDLAGIYMELWGCFVLFLGYIFTKNAFFIFALLLILFNTYKNINPFLRYDGYWAFSDLIQVPNLRTISTQKASAFFKNVFQRDFNALKQLNKISIILILYGTLSWAFIFLLLLFLLFSNYNLITQFPMKIIHFLMNIGFDFQLIFLKLKAINVKEIILPLIFYFFLGRLLSRFIKSILSNKKYRFKSILNSV